jgi:hypothetical protein
VLHVIPETRDRIFRIARRDLQEYSHAEISTEIAPTIAFFGFLFLLTGRSRGGGRRAQRSCLASSSSTMASVLLSTSCVICLRTTIDINSCTKTIQRMVTI